MAVFSLKCFNSYMKLNHEKYLGDKLAYKISMKQDDLGFHDKGLKKIHVK